LLGALPAPAGYKPPARGERVGGFEGRANGSMIGGVSIVKPKEYGGIMAYDMNAGDKKWWAPNAGMSPVTSNDPLFAGVQLPPQGGRGQAEIITTKSLLIYGPGRNGGGQGRTPQIYALDKATGKQVGAVKIPGLNTAVPMTFMHEGKQYIVFAMGGGDSPTLVALALPGAAGTGGRH